MFAFNVYLQKSFFKTEENKILPEKRFALPRKTDISRELEYVFFSALYVDNTFTKMYIMTDTFSAGVFLQNTVVFLFSAWSFIVDKCLIY